jgi:hypothetical protein
MRLLLSARMVAAITLGALLAVSPATAAKGNAGPNAFAGKFVGLVPGGYSAWEWPISISGSGKITGKIDLDGLVTGSFSGTVDRDGQMKCSGTERVLIGYPAITIYINFTATATVDSDGDIVGTTDTGATFVWARQ